MSVTCAASSLNGSWSARCESDSSTLVVVNTEKSGYKLIDVTCNRGRWVGLVVIRLNISVFQRLVQAGNDRLDFERRIPVQGIRKDVASGNFNTLLIEIVHKDNEAILASRGVADNILPVVKDLLCRN